MIYISELYLRQIFLIVGKYLASRALRDQIKLLVNYSATYLCYKNYFSTVSFQPISISFVRAH